VGIIFIKLTLFLHKHSLWYVEHFEKIPHIFHTGKLVPKPFSIMVVKFFKYTLIIYNFLAFFDADHIELGPQNIVEKS